MPRIIIKDPSGRIPAKWLDALDELSRDFHSEFHRFGVLVSPDHDAPLEEHELSTEWIVLFSNKGGLSWPKDVPRVIGVRTLPCSLSWVEKKLRARAHELTRLYTPINADLVREQEKLLQEIRTRLTSKTEQRRGELEEAQRKLRLAQQKLIRLNALIASLSQSSSEDELNALLTEQIPLLVSSSGPLNVEDESILDQIREVTSLIFHHKTQLRNLQKMTEEWTETFNSIDDPIAVVNTQLERVRSNSSYDRRGLDAHSSLKLGKLTKAALNTGKIHSGEIFMDQLNQWYFVRCIPVRQGQRKSSMAVIYYRDITASRNIRQHILQAEKLTDLGVLAGSVAHEINNPLAGIIAFIQLTKSAIGSSHHAFQDFKEMERAALQCRAIVQNLLSFSRKANLEECGLMSIHQIFETIAPLIHLQLKHENIDSYFHAPKETKGYFVHGSFNHFLQILLNLSTLCLEDIRETAPTVAFHWTAGQFDSDHYSIDIIPKQSGDASPLPRRQTDQTLWNLCHYVTEELVRQNSGWMESFQKGSDKGWRVVFPKATMHRRDLAEDLQEIG